MDIGNKENSQLFLSMETLDEGKRHILDLTTEEKDSAVTVTNNLKFYEHISIIAGKANSVFGQLKRIFMNWTVKTLTNLYTGFVRPHLEYSASVW